VGDLHLGKLPEVDRVCASLTDLLGDVQLGIRATAHHHAHGIVVILPSILWLPPEPSGISQWLVSYGAVGLIRGAAATEAIYGVRVNGLVCEPGHEALVGPLLRYLFSTDSAWLNGSVLTVDGQGVGLLADERPRWQTFSESGSFTLPSAFGHQISMNH
jgi:hypothetical protein